MRIITLTLISTLILSSCGTVAVKENPLPEKKEIPGATVVVESSTYSGQATMDTGNTLSSSGTYREPPK